MKPAETQDLVKGGLAIVGVWLLLCSCKSSKPFHVNVNAEEPIKIDLNMDVHVYNHGGENSKKSEVNTNASSSADDNSEAAEYAKILESRRNRMAEVQNMKNARYVGENRLGLLELRSLPEEDSAVEWVKKTLSEENDDRKYLMDHEVETKGKTLKEVQAEQRQHILRKSHVGEWVEMDDIENPGSYKWVQKVSPKKAPVNAELPDVEPVDDITKTQ